MYQRLSEKAREVLETAQALAQDQQLEYVGTEQLLVAMLDHEECIAAQLLVRRGVSLSAVREGLRQCAREPRQETLVLGRLSGSPYFQEAVGAAIREAEASHEKTIGTDHLLLGLLEQKGSSAEQVLAGMGVAADALRAELALQGGPKARRGRSRG